MPKPGVPKSDGPRFRDLEGQRFGILTVTTFAGVRDRSYWNVQCDCGAEFETQSTALLSGRARSCGCVRVEKIIIRNKAADHSLGLTHKGKTQRISEWGKEIGMKHGTIRSRLSHGWTVDRALTTPVRVYAQLET